MKHHPTRSWSIRDSWTPTFYSHNFQPRTWASYASSARCLTARATTNLPACPRSTPRQPAGPHLRGLWPGRRSAGPQPATPWSGTPPARRPGRAEGRAAARPARSAAPAAGSRGSAAPGTEERKQGIGRGPGLPALLPALPAPLGTAPTSRPPCGFALLPHSRPAQARVWGTAARPWGAGWDSPPAVPPPHLFGRRGGNGRDKLIEAGSAHGNEDGLHGRRQHAPPAPELRLGCGQAGARGRARPVPALPKMAAGWGAAPAFQLRPLRSVRFCAAEGSVQVLLFTEEKSVLKKGFSSMGFSLHVLF